MRRFLPDMRDPRIIHRMGRWICMLMGAVLIGSGCSKPVVESAEVKADPVALLRAEGASIFRTKCFVCHQMDGGGIAGTTPPLAGSSWLLDPASPARATRILLHGLSGRIVVKGESFDGQMPNLQLNDREIAAVLTYIRSEWGHAATPIDPSYVASIRARYGDRGPWTPYELLAEFPVAE